MIAKTYISTFLSHFEYLNSKGFRNGFLLFSNKPLTAAHEKNAKILKLTLGQLVNDVNQTEEHKCLEMINAIRNTYEACKKAREEYTPWKHYAKSYDGSPSLDIDPCTVTYDYKKPYRPSKFEKEILKAVEALIAKSEEFIHPRADIHYTDAQISENAKNKLTAEVIKKECCTLVYDINHFKPKKIIMNWKSR